MSIIVEKTDPASYTTQAKLLLCQTIYDILSTSPKQFSAATVLDRFKTHPLIEDAGMKLNQAQLLQLVNRIMEENQVLTAEQVPKAFEEYREHVKEVIQVCNVYFIARTAELEAEIGQNQKEFRAEAAKASKQ